MSGVDKKPASSVAKLGASPPSNGKLQTEKSGPKVCKPGAAKPLIPFDPLLADDGSQVVFTWATSTSPFFHTLAKVVVREICAYLVQEITQVHAIDSGYLYVYDLRTEQGRHVALSMNDLRFIQHMRNVRISSSRVFCCGGEGIFYLELFNDYSRKCVNDACIVSFDGSVQNLPPMIIERSGHGVVSFKRRVFVFGGGKFDYIGRIKGAMICESFNFDSGKWSKLPNLHFPRAWCDTSRLGDHIYIYGNVPKTEIFWINTRAITIAEFSLPMHNIVATVKQNTQLLMFTTNQRFVLRREEQKDVLEVTEGVFKNISGSYSVYWKGKFYSDGGSDIKWINAYSYSEYDTVYSRRMRKTRILGN